MLCAIYKSPKKEGMYLYIAKRDQFDIVPESLRQAFGKPQFVMLFNLNSGKALQSADNATVRAKIETGGFYLQMPPPMENLHQQFLDTQRLNQSVL